VPSKYQYLSYPKSFPMPLKVGDLKLTSIKLAIDVLRWSICGRHCAAKFTRHIEVWGSALRLTLSTNSVRYTAEARCRSLLTYIVGDWDTLPVRLYKSKLKEARQYRLQQVYPISTMRSIGARLDPGRLLVFKSRGTDCPSVRIGVLFYCHAVFTTNQRAVIHYCHFHRFL
jgi:hypothetical protein